MKIKSTELKDKEYFKKFLQKKYKFLRQINEDDLEEILPKLQELKAEIHAEFADIADLDIDFVVLPSVESAICFDIMMVYNDKYTFQF